MLRRQIEVVVPAIAALAATAIATYLFALLVTGSHAPIASLNLAYFGVAIAFPTVAALVVWGYVFQFRFRVLGSVIAGLLTAAAVLWYLSVPAVEVVGDSTILRSNFARDAFSALSVITTTSIMSAFASVIFWCLHSRMNAARAS